MNSWVALLGFVILVTSSCAGAPRQMLREGFELEDGRLPEGWRVVSGNWRVQDRALVVDSLDGEASIRAGDESWKDYEVEVTATFLKVKERSRWLALVFRASADGKPAWSQFAVRQGTEKDNGLEFAVRNADDRWSVRMQDKGPSTTAIGQQRHLRVVVRGEKVQLYLDKKEVIQSAFCVDRTSGCVGLGVSGCVVKFDDFAARELPEGPKPLPPVEHPERCECVAHRGYSAVAPENTMVSVVKGMEAGADGCEFDVRLSKDGVAVLMHDSDVKRTTDGKGKVRELTLAQLQELDAGSWKSPEYKGEPVSTLVDVLKRMKQSKCVPVIEVKENGMARQVVDAVNEAGILDRAVVISFEDRAIADIKAIEPRIPCAFLLGKKLHGTVEQQAEYLTTRAKLCKADMLDLNYRMLSPELLVELQKRGFKVWCWTVDEPPVMTALARWGVESITTNRPDLLVELRKSLPGR